MLLLFYIHCTIKFCLPTRRRHEPTRGGTGRKEGGGAHHQLLLHTSLIFKVELTINIFPYTTLIASVELNNNFFSKHLRLSST
jgi:hypothetical protein